MFKKIGIKNIFRIMIPAFIVLFFCVYSAPLYAVGTKTGSNIINGHDLQVLNIADTWGDLVIEYTSNGDSYYNTADTPSTSVVVSVYGDTITNPPDSEAFAGNTVYYQIRITNAGNAPDSFVISGTFAKSLGGWYFDFYADTLSGGTIAYTATLAEDAETTIYAGVYIPDTAVPPDSTQLTVTISSNYGKGDTNGYTGDNGVKYAGDGNDSTVIITSVTAQAYMYISKSVSIQTPASYNGVAGNAIPGARLTYTITYDNDGADSAGNISITEYIPQNTTFDTATAAMADPDSNNLSGVTITYSNDGTNFFAVPPVGVTHIRWTITNPVSPESFGTNADADGTADSPQAPDYDAGRVRFRVTID